MIVFEPSGYTIKRFGDPEEVIHTINELVSMIGHLPDDYPMKNIWRVTSLVCDMLPEGEILNEINN